MNRTEKNAILTQIVLNVDNLTKSDKEAITACAVGSVDLDDILVGDLLEKAAKVTEYARSKFPGNPDQAAREEWELRNQAAGRSPREYARDQRLREIDLEDKADIEGFKGREDMDNVYPARGRDIRYYEPEDETLRARRRISAGLNPPRANLTSCAHCGADQQHWKK